MAGFAAVRSRASDPPPGIIVALYRSPVPDPLFLGIPGVDGWIFAGLVAAWAEVPLFGSGLGATAEQAARINEAPWSYELQYAALLYHTGLVGFLQMTVGALVACTIITGRETRSRASSEIWRLNPACEFSSAFNRTTADFWRRRR